MLIIIVCRYESEGSFQGDEDDEEEEEEEEEEEPEEETAAPGIDPLTHSLTPSPPGHLPMSLRESCY